jgi:predicted transcriptional regulator
VIAPKKEVVLMKEKASSKIMLEIKPTEKVYRAFYDTREILLYFNQLKEITGLSDSSLANALKKLRESNEIERIKEKSNTFFRIT